MKVYSRLMKTTSVDALQTAALQFPSKYYFFCDLSIYQFDLVLSKLEKERQSQKLEKYLRLRIHSRIGMGAGSDLLDTWDLPIKGGYFSKERLYSLCLPWEGCSYFEKFVFLSFESGV